MGPARPLHDPDPRVSAPARLSLPFDAVDPSVADLGALVTSCAIDHDVPPVPGSPGGAREAEARLDRFVGAKLAAYLLDPNDPSRDATTNLSAHLHWGAISARRIALAVRDAAVERGAIESGDALLEQLLVRRGLAFNFAARSPDPTSYDSLPRWARATLEAHARDERPSIVPLARLEAAESPDALWNAAQSELLHRGVIQNYARMLLGKAGAHLDVDSRRGARDPRSIERPLRARRTRSRRMGEHRLVLRPPRPPLAGAGDLRHRPDDDDEVGAIEAPVRGLHHARLRLSPARPLQGSGTAGPPRTTPSGSGTGSRRTSSQSPSMSYRLRASSWKTWTTTSP